MADRNIISPEALLLLKRLENPQDKTAVSRIPFMGDKRLMQVAEEIRQSRLLALNSPHSVRDNNPLGLGGEYSTSRDSTETSKVRLKKPTPRNILFMHTPAYAPTSPIPKEMLTDTSLIWHKLKNKED